MEWIQSIDTGILLFIQEHIRNEAFHSFWRAITFLGAAGWFWLALAVILLIPQRTRKAGFTALLSMGIGALLTNVFLKNAVSRIRPYDAVEAIADKSLEQKTGARGLRSIMEHPVEDLMYEIPSDEDIIACTITRDAVEFTGAPEIERKGA